MYTPVKDGIAKTADDVSYVEAPPPDHLRAVVHCFWEIKTEGSLAEDFRYHVIPDACVNVLFNRMDPRVAAITAIRTTSKVLNLGKAFHYVGVQLLPGVWRGDPSELLDGYVDQPYAGALPLVHTNTLLSGRSFQEQQPLMAKLIDDLISAELVAVDGIVSSIFMNVADIHSVSDMARVANLSPRQLQRKLKRATGFAPHDFLKVLRVQHSFKESYLSHYADQAHFIHSFKNVTGYTPISYKKKFDV